MVKGGGHITENDLVSFFLDHSWFATTFLLFKELFDRVEVVALDTEINLVVLILQVGDGHNCMVSTSLAFLPLS